MPSGASIPVKPGTGQPGEVGCPPGRAVPGSAESRGLAGHERGPEAFSPVSLLARRRVRGPASLGGPSQREASRERSRARDLPIRS